MKYCTKCGMQIPDGFTTCPQCQPIVNNQHTQVLSKNPLVVTSKNRKEKSITNIKQNAAYICPIIVGIILFLVGLFIQIPGGALTTYESLDGDKTYGYAFDDKYSSIDEYVGGDAYNYIIGAALVAGKISGTMTTKAIFIVGGILCTCLGITLKMLPNKKIVIKSSMLNNTESTNTH